MTRIVAGLCLAAGLRAQTAAVPWSSYAHDPQHTGLSTIGAERLEVVKWSTPVDLVLQGASGPLYIHYGSPLVTAGNTALVPVRTSSSNTYRVEAHSGANGTLLYTLPTDFTPPPHNWIPSYSPALSQGTRLYYPGAGGTVYYRDQPDSASGPSGQIAFYGNALYAANQAAFAASVMISTPITADAAGNIYFGFDVTGPNPANLTSGLARIGANGSGSWIGASAAAQGDPSIVEVALNCAPALSNDGSTLYFGVSEGNSTGGYLVAVNSTTMAPIARIRLKDPETGLDALLLDDGSASPTVGPDGDVYYGVFESSCCTNDDRGWLLHFNATLTETKTPGAFGWDTTASVVPASLVPSYHGASSYLLFTKYNNYLGVGPGGNGLNKIAVLDPNGTETDPITGATVMLEAITILGPTPAAGGGVREWCINSGAIDPFAAAVIANSEDGVVYRWNFATNSFTQQVHLTAGVGEAYTPTAVGADGTAYAINDAVLFAVGQAANLTIASTHSGNFIAGQSGAVYTLTVTNSGSGATNGAVTVTDTLPGSLTATSIAGLGWSCAQPGGPCTRSDTLPANGSYAAITLTVNVATTAPSTVTNTATVSSDGAVNSVNSTASDSTSVTALSLAVTPSSLIFDVPTQSAFQSQTVSVTDSPAVAVPVTATPAVTAPAGSAWLAATGGTTPFISAVTVTGASLAAGQYTGTVAYASVDAAGAANVPVLLNVGQLTVTGGPVTFNDQLGVTTSPGTATLSVSAGPAAINWVSSATGDCAWLTDSASSGVTPRNGSSPVAVGYTLAGAAAASVGVHVCTLSYQAAASYGSTAPAATTTVTLTVSNTPVLTVAPAASQTVSATVGSVTAATAQFQVSAVAPSTTPPNTVAVSVTPSAFNPAGVFTASLSSADTPSTLTVTANPTGLVQATYTGNFTISSPSIATPVTVTVFLDVTPGCQFTVTPAIVPLTNAVPVSGTPVTQAGSFTVTPGGACPVTPWTATPNAPWLTIASGGSGSGSGIVTVTFNALSNPTSGTCNGAFFCGPPDYGPTIRTGTITITPATGTPVTVQVTQPGSTAPLAYRQVTALYQTILGRDPDPAGYAFWTGGGAAGLSQMADDFLSSPEAFNSDFAVTAAYQAATGAPPTYAQFTSAVTRIRTGTEQIGVLFSTLIAGNPSYTAATLYQNLLNRAPGPGDASCIGAGLAACFQAIIGFPASTAPADAVNNEFQNTGTFANLTSHAGDHTNTLYITMLYFVILARDPDPGGLQFWIGIANGGGAGLLFQGLAGYPTRFQILGTGLPLQGFLGSVEFEDLYQ